MNFKVETYGVYNHYKNDANSNLSKNVEEIYYNGFTILEDVFDPATIAKSIDQFDKLLETQNKEAIDNNAFLEADNDILRCPLGYDHFFVEIASNSIVMELMRKILGSNFILMMQNGIVNRPNTKQYQTKWHRDLNYQHFISSEPLALNFLVMLNDFKVENGCTWVLPSSHLRAEFPSDDFVRKYEIPVTGKAGSVAVLDAMLYHRSGRNTTDNDVRRGLNHVVGKPFIAQQINLPQFIKSNRDVSYDNDEFLSKYLGYTWGPSSDVISWKKSRV